MVAPTSLRPLPRNAGLDGSDVVGRFEQWRRKAMTEHVAGGALGKMGVRRCARNRLVDDEFVDVMTPEKSQRRSGPAHCYFPQTFDCFLRKRCVVVSISHYARPRSDVNRKMGAAVMPHVRAAAARYRQSSEVRCYRGMGILPMRVHGRDARATSLVPRVVADGAIGVGEMAGSFRETTAGFSLDFESGKWESAVAGVLMGASACRDFALKSPDGNNRVTGRHVLLEDPVSEFVENVRGRAGRAVPQKRGRRCG